MEGRIKFVLTSILVFLTGIVVMADEKKQDTENNLLSVVSFYEDPTDLTANLQGSIMYDQNGDKCALIKVQTVQQGFAFSCGMMSPVSLQQKTGEIWLYVPYGIKHLKIQHPRLGTVTYPINIKIEKARTYIMELATANVVVIAEPDMSLQYLVLAVDPANAYVEIDGKAVENKNGIITKLLPVGKHSYSVSLADYHTATGDVDIMTKKCLLKVYLKPAFGFLNIPGSDTLSRATVFVDDRNIGVVPVSNCKLPSGSHKLKIVCPKYKTYLKEITIEDEKSLSIAPNLTPNYKTVSISSMQGAEIWINDKKVGLSPWQGNLEYGHYAIECRMKGYVTSYHSAIISEESQRDIVFREPSPIYGKMSIESNHPGATVLLDGNEVGETPLFLPQVLIGNHIVCVKQKGYQDFSMTAGVEKNQIFRVMANLAKSSKGAQNPEDKKSPSVGEYGGNGASVGKPFRGE